MANPNQCDLTEDRVFYLTTSLIYRLVCAPSSWSTDKIADVVSATDPPGTSVGRWVCTDPHPRDDDFNNINNLPCPDDCNRTHWLMNC